MLEFKRDNIKDVLESMNIEVEYVQDFRVFDSKGIEKYTNSYTIPYNTWDNFIINSLFTIKPKKAYLYNCKHIREDSKEFCWFRCYFEGINKDVECYQNNY